MITNKDLIAIEKLNESIREMLSLLNDAYQGEWPLYPHHLEEAYKKFCEASNQLGILDMNQLKIDYIATLENVKE